MKFDPTHSDESDNGVFYAILVVFLLCVALVMGLFAYGISNVSACNVDEDRLSQSLITIERLENRLVLARGDLRLSQLEAATYKRIIAIQNGEISE